MDPLDASTQQALDIASGVGAVFLGVIIGIVVLRRRRNRNAEERDRRLSEQAERDERDIKF